MIIFTREKKQPGYTKGNKYLNLKISLKVLLLLPLLPFNK